MTPLQFHQLGNGVLQVSVVEDNKWAIATKLHGHFLDALGTVFRN